MPIDFSDHMKSKNSKDSSGGNGGNGGGNKKFEPLFQPPDFMKGFNKKMGLVYVIIILIVLVVISKPYDVINSGQIGIKVTAGKFEPMPLQPGIHFFLPIIQKVLIVDTKVRVINYTSNERGSVSSSTDGVLGNSSISVLDHRGLPVEVDLTVQYRLNSSNAPETIASWGLSWEEKIINPVVRDVVRSVIGKFPAEELPGKRNEIAVGIEDGIRAKVENLTNRPVQVESVQLRAIILPPKIQEQIERVQVARQETERARYEVERAIEGAKRKAEEARGEANAKKINAEGTAQAVLIEADANAKSNKLISESLTPRLLELRAIEVQGKFNEALKDNKDASIFLTPGGAVPNIWLDTKNKQKATSASGN
ncbi:MAG: SPFH domain-containing protein [Campylobacterales bacterium]